jgi:hypothetical protein
MTVRVIETVAYGRSATSGDRETDGYHWERHTS